MRLEKEMREYWTNTVQEMGSRPAIISSSLVHAWDEITAVNLPMVDVGIKPTDHVLEIGCGIGRLMRPLAARCLSITGLDITPQMIQEGQQYVAGCPNVFFRQIVEESLRWPVVDGEFDYAYSFLLFQHLPTREMTRLYLSEAARALKIGSVFRMQTHRGYPPPPGVFGNMMGAFYPSLVDLGFDAEAAGFDVIMLETGIGHPEWLWLTARKG